MKKLIVSMLCGLMIGFSGSGFAGGFQTGNTLLAKCKSEDSYNFGFCLGYIEGVNDAHDALAEGMGVSPVCWLPENVTAGQLEKVVIKHLEAHPEDLHLGASGLVLSALYKAFPCE